MGWRERTGRGAREAGSLSLTLAAAKLGRRQLRVGRTRGGRLGRDQGNTITMVMPSQNENLEGHELLTSWRGSGSPRILRSAVLLARLSGSRPRMSPWTQVPAFHIPGGLS